MSRVGAVLSGWGCDGGDAVGDAVAFTSFGAHYTS